MAPALVTVAGDSLVLLTFFLSVQTAMPIMEVMRPGHLNQWFSPYQVSMIQCASSIEK